MNTRRHRIKPKGSIIAALDIGSAKIVCLIAQAIDDHGTLKVVGIGHHASAGIRNGTIVDLDALEVAIRQTVHAAEKMASYTIHGYPLRDVVVNLSAAHATSHNMAVDVQIAGYAITDNDISRALARAQEHIDTDDDDLIHTLATGYAIDDSVGIKEPSGMFGQTLKVDVHMVSANHLAIKNLMTTVNRSHLDIEAICLSTYADGLACLVEDEMDLGCTVINLGAGTTSFAVFHGNALIYSDHVPVAGQHVTNDIARGLTTSVVNAERLKTLYGSAIASSSDDSELIDVPQVGEEERDYPNHMPRSLLVGIIQPRLEEIFEMVRGKLKDSGLGPMMGRRVVLTGGGAQLPGLRDLSQAVLDKQVRIGRPIRLTSLPDSLSGPAFTTAAGLLTYIANRTDDMPDEIMRKVRPENLWGRVRLWLQENW